MQLIFTNIKCKSCFIRLTEFEASEKRGLCMDCFRDKIEEDKKIAKSF